MSDDRELIYLLASELAAATGHTFRNARSRRLRKLTRHDRRMANGDCLTCALLDIAEENPR